MSIHDEASGGAYIDGPSRAVDKQADIVNGMTIHGSGETLQYDPWYACRFWRCEKLIEHRQRPVSLQASLA
jgi:hypothetical protein